MVAVIGTREAGGGKRKARFLVLCTVLLSVCGAAQADDLARLISALERGGAPRGQAEVGVYFPPRKDAVQPAPRLPRLSLLPALLRQNFVLNAPSAERFLGREVTRLELSPRRSDAARWTFWVDLEWNTPLAFEQRSFDGKLLRRAAYVTLEVQPIPKRRAAPAPLKLRPGLERKVDGVLTRLSPPEGFRLIGAKRAVRGDLPTLELTYSDGLNSFPLVLASRGTRVAEGIAVRKIGSLWLWMVGSFPRPALENTLSSVQGLGDVEGLGTFVDGLDSKD